ncbi:hypothetical protein Btru_077683 [Bulinus truncatus]|nr:hypothetical protein Btru_077683 [Bulinus truncatus]
MQLTLLSSLLCLCHLPTLVHVRTLPSQLNQSGTTNQFSSEINNHLPGSRSTTESKKELVRFFTIVPSIVDIKVNIMLLAEVCQGLKRLGSPRTGGFDKTLERIENFDVEVYFEVEIEVQFKSRFTSNFSSNQGSHLISVQIEVQIEVQFRSRFSYMFSSDQGSLICSVQIEQNPNSGKGWDFNIPSLPPTLTVNYKI